MKKSLLLYTFPFLLIFTLSCASGNTHRSAGTMMPKDRPKPAYNASSLEKKVHALINRERKKNGLGQLEWDDALAKIARGHSRDMGSRNYFSHYSPEGRDFLFRYNKKGYACGVRIGQIIYQGAENIFQNNLADSVTTVNGKEYYDWNSEEHIAETTVSGWMKSPGHRKNILTPHWSKEGIGVFITPEGKVYITQNFC